MRSLYIADDEKAIRDGIKLIVDWKGLGYEVCGEAGNGTKAVSDITVLNPDLVLMDIRMPGLSGLDTIRKLTEDGFEGHFIILSGFSDFKYAQEAMKYNVRHYLTKPVDEEELIAAVREISEMLDNKATAQSRALFLQNKSKKEIIRDIISHETDIKLLNLTDLGLSADRYQVIAYENFNLSDSELPYRFSELFNAAGNMSRASVHLVFRGHDILLLVGDSGIERFQRFLEHYESIPEQNSPLDRIFVAYGCVVHSLSELSDSYAQAEELLARRFFCVQGQHVLGYDDLPSVQNNLEKLENSRIEGFAASIIDYLQAFKRRNVAEVLYSLEEYLYHVNADISAVKLFLADLFLRIKDSISHRYTTGILPFDSNAQIIAFINTSNYLYEIIIYFSKAFEALMDSIGTPSRNNIIDDIIYYIDHNYNTNLKLDMIASLFGYNSSYLGKIFTKTVGESFNTYVDRIRIRHAIEMLGEDRYKVYEIARKVGYSDVDYFHKKFKKYTGESPAEYRLRPKENQ